MYLLFYVIVFKIKIIYLQFRGSKWRTIVRTQNQMIFFVISYVALMIPFFGIAVLTSDTNPEKYKYLYCLGAVIAIQNFLLAFNFVRQLLRLQALFGDQEHSRDEQYTVGNFLRSPAARKAFLALWLLVYAQDVIYNTFLRPAGTLNFLQEPPTELASNSVAYHYNEYLTVNQNLSVFLIGLFVISIYRYFGERYNQMIKAAYAQEGDYVLG